MLFSRLQNLNVYVIHLDLFLQKVYLFLSTWCHIKLQCLFFFSKQNFHFTFTVIKASAKNYTDIKKQCKMIVFAILIKKNMMDKLAVEDTFKGFGFFF